VPERFRSSSAAQPGRSAVPASFRSITGREAARFEVSDDGAGFVVDDPGRRNGTRLASIADRIEALGGSLTIDSAPGRGTRVQASVPNPKRRR
jgi:signal transduction histidine kinase